MSLVERGRKTLAKLWKQSQKPNFADSFTVDKRLSDAIEASINCKTKTYRYVLPTQLLAKLIDPRLDCRALQEGGDSEGSFDARSLCAKVIAPFDAANHNVLGGSGDPYVSNPLRQPSLSTETRRAHKDKVGFDNLLAVLEHAEHNPESTEDLLLCALWAIRRRLATVHIVYPVPNRASHLQVKSIITTFLSQRTGGLRLQIVSIALFKTLGLALHIFDDVTSANINAADSQTGKVADLECVDNDGKVVLAVEVKDRQLTFRAVSEKLPQIRERGIRELLFVIQGGIAKSDRDQVEQTISQEFAAGQNVYVSEFESLLHVALIMLGEVGRRHFLVAMGQTLDRFKVDLAHREDWRNLLQCI